MESLGEIREDHWKRDQGPWDDQAPDDRERNQPQELSMRVDPMKRAAERFEKDGFVIIRGAVGEEKTERIRDICGKIFEKCLKSGKGGNRGENRYSVSASRCLKINDLANLLLNNEEVINTVRLIFKRGGRPEFQNDKPYVSRIGGDFCDKGAEDQELHSDMKKSRPLDKSENRKIGELREEMRKILEIEDQEDREEERKEVVREMAELAIHDKKTPILCADFCLENFTDGAIRMVKWEEMREGDPPGREEEIDLIEKGKLKRIEIKMERGDVLLRDIRVWHGGTRKLSEGCRFLPLIEFVNKLMIKKRTVYRDLSRRVDLIGCAEEVCVKIRSRGSWEGIDVNDFMVKQFRVGDEEWDWKGGWEGGWVCGCGFRNQWNNNVCGGQGSLGCKAEMPSPAAGNQSKRSETPGKTSPSRNVKGETSLSRIDKGGSRVPPIEIWLPILIICPCIFFKFLSAKGLITLVGEK